jgi:hypothetical protein
MNRGSEVSYSIVTSSYAGDFERCKLLAQSVERMVGGNHYVLVDPVDVTLFKQLEDYGANIIDSRELMPFRQVPFTRLWRNGQGGFIRGWMSQQIRKIAFAEVALTDNILFVDSDVVFVRPFHPESLTRDGRTPLFTIDWFNTESLGWANQSRKLFGKPAQERAHGYPHPTFWRKTIVIDMLDSLTRLHEMPWQTLLAKQQTLSEYTLYGIFAEEVRGIENTGLYSFNEALMHPSWDYDLRRGMDKFFSELLPSSVAMMFHSKDNVPVKTYRTRVEELWAQSEASYN